MPTEKRPGVYFDETTEYELEGNGGKIPVFIGKTGNSATTGYAVDGTQILKFKNYTEACRTIHTTTNLRTIYPFSARQRSSGKVRCRAGQHLLDYKR